jgi:hypothetical protein
MSGLGALLFLPVAWAIGRALLPGRGALPRSRWEEAGAAYLLGAAAIAVLGTAGVAAGLPFAATWALTVALGGGAIGWLIWRRRTAPEPPLQPLGWNLPAALLLGALGIGAAALTVAYPLNEFDPIFHFAYRAKILHYQGTVLDEALLGLEGPDGYGRVVTHPNYPLGLPILEAWAAQLGGWNDRWVKLPLAAWAACLPAAVAFGLRGCPPAAARRAALLVACTPMLYVADVFARGADDWREAGLSGMEILDGGADLPVAALFALACGLLLRAWQSADRRCGACAGLAFAGAAMMKNEGLALAGVALLATVLAAALPARPPLRPTLFCWAAAALALAPWLAVRAQLPAIDENYGEQLTVARVLDALGGMEEPREQVPPGMAAEAEAAAGGGALLRREQVASALGEEFMDLRSWGLLWPVAAIALVMAARRWREAEARWLALVVLGGLLLYLTILLVTPWYFPSLREKGIPERLLLHLVGPCAFLAGCALAPRAAR